MPSVGSASTIDLSDIVSTDELGYECISGEHFEEVDNIASVAFSVGKKIRLPRTCLPEPCDGAISQQELSNITGTEMIYPRFQDEWNEYYARYADYCRKETVGTTVAGTVVPQEDFWQPFRTPTIPGFVTTPTQTPTTPPIVVTSNTPTTPPDLPSTPTVFSSNPPTTDDDVSPSVGDVSQVPLPASWMLLGGAVAVLLRRKRK